MASDQESFVQEILDDELTKVIVVNSHGAVRLLSEDTDLVSGSSDDPLRSLRRFALIQTRVKLTGNYRRCLVVHYSECRPVLKNLDDLTPSRQLVLPHQLLEVKDWVHETSTRATDSATTNQIETELKLCHQRLVKIWLCEIK